MGKSLHGLLRTIYQVEALISKRQLTGFAGPDYYAATSFGMLHEPEDSLILEIPGETPDDNEDCDTSSVCGRPSGGAAVLDVNGGAIMSHEGGSTA